MFFKKRIDELKSINHSDAAVEGAELCHETLKTSKAILDDVMGTGQYDSKDLLDLYSKLVSCEIEVNLKKIYLKSSQSKEDLEALQVINARKKLNNLS